MFNALDANPIMFSILDNIDNGAMIKNNDGIVIHVNQKLEELLGYSAEELIGRTNKEIILLLVGEPYLKEINRNISKVIEGHNVTEKRKLRHKSGQYVPLEVKASPIYDGGKNVQGELLIFKDRHEELIVKVTRLVNSTLSLSEVMKNTTNAVVDNIGLASCAIFLLNNEQTKLQLAACNVFKTKEDCEKVIFNMGEGPPGLIAKYGKPIYVANLRTEQSLPEYARKFHSDKSSIGYPLRCNEELLGVIAFDADVVREFTEIEQLVFENIAGQVAIAIYNAKLFSQLAHLSITDGLTGVYNHRYLQERLEEEIKRANRYNGYLSLLMLDVDNFKNYNDTHGHLYGDEILKQIAVLIQQNVRNFDVVARYGGEEFAVILIDCPKEEAIKIASRIQHSIEKYNFYGREKQPGGKVTASIGLALYRQPFTNKNLLLNADNALYKAKRAGRNRVEIHAV